jgi:hypothetical protein
MPKSHDSDDLDSDLKEYLEGEKNGATRWIMRMLNKLSAELMSSRKEYTKLIESHEEEDQKRHTEVARIVDRLDVIERRSGGRSLMPSDLKKHKSESSGVYHVPDHEMDQYFAEWELKKAAAKWEGLTKLGIKILSAVLTVAAIGAAGYFWRDIAKGPVQSHNTNQAENK